MEELLRELEQSKILRQFLQSRVPRGEEGSGCIPNCKWILDDLEKHGKLTGFPLDSVSLPIYPIDSKLLHLHIELIGPCPEEFFEDRVYLVEAVVIRLRSTKIGN